MSKDSANESVVKDQETITESSEITECPVCYEPIKSYGFCVTNCDHTFCMDCMMNHIQANQGRSQATSCPLCRNEIIPYVDHDGEGRNYIIGFNAGYEHGVEESHANEADIHQQGFAEGAESTSQFAQEWRKRYQSLNLIYKATVTQLQMTNTHIKKARGLDLKRTTSLD